MNGIHNIFDALIIFGTLPFWILSGLILCFLIGSVANDAPKWGSFWGALAVLIIVHNVGPQPWYVITGVIVGYGILGGVWAIYRWLQYCRFHVREFTESGHTRADKGVYNSLEYKLRPSGNKGLIYMWITFWPASFVWSITGDLVRGIYNQIAGFLGHITLRELQKVK